MTIDLSKEQLVAIKDAPKHIPGRPDISTLYRWVMRKSGALETFLVGGKRFTSVEAIHRFIEGCNRTGDKPTSRTTARRNRDQLRANREMEAAGI